MESNRRTSADIHLTRPAEIALQEKCPIQIDQGLDTMQGREIPMHGEHGGATYTTLSDGYTPYSVL